MPQTLSIIYLSWDSSSNINHRISGGYSDGYIDKISILAPSLPMLISHQLGTYNPTQGLVFCSIVFDYYIDNKHLRIPINSAFKSARIEFVKTDQGNVTLQFYPEIRLFSNSDSCEEASRQLLNNYLAYVNKQLPEQTRLIIKTFVGSIIHSYLNMIKGIIEKGNIGPQLDKWTKDISAHMAIETLEIAKIYGPTLPKEANLPLIKENTDNFYLQIQKEHKLICKKMGMVR